MGSLLETLISIGLAALVASGALNNFALEREKALINQHVNNINYYRRQDNLVLHRLPRVFECSGRAS